MEQTIGRWLEKPTGITNSSTSANIAVLMTTKGYKEHLFLCFFLGVVENASTTVRGAPNRTSSPSIASCAAHREGPRHAGPAGNTRLHGSSRHSTGHQPHFCTSYTLLSRAGLPPTADTQGTDRRTLNLRTGRGQQNKSKGTLLDFDLRCCLQTPAQAGLLGAAGTAPLPFRKLQRGGVTAPAGTCNRLPAPLCQSGRSAGHSHAGHGRAFQCVCAS